MATHIKLISLTWPVLVELLLTFLVATVGMYFAAGQSNAELAIYSLGNQIFHFFFLLFRVISMGLAVMVAQYLGAKNEEAAKHTAFAALAATTAMLLVLNSLMLLGAPFWLTWLNTPNELKERSEHYVQLLALALVFDAYWASFLATMRAHLHSRHTMVLSIVGHLSHLLFALVLMSPSALNLGVLGFAIALLVSRILALTASVVLWRKLLHYHLRWQHLIDLGKQARAYLKPVMRVGIPGAVEAATYRFGILATIALAGSMGTEALSLQAAVLQCASFAGMLIVAVGFASEIKVGHLVGAGQFKAAHQMVKKTIWVSVVVAVLVGFVMAIVSPTALRHLGQAESMIGLGLALMLINVLLEIGRASNIIMVMSLRAVGDAQYTSVMSIPVILLVMAGGAWLLGGLWQLGLIGVWVAYTLDEWVRAGLNARRWFSLRWVQKAKRAYRHAQNA